ncbi:MAG: sensor histidine kinase [Planctomycetota bacterium]|jgi:two-component system phosphate regulon sensor histidine kinase PhoR
MFRWIQLRLIAPTALLTLALFFLLGYFDRAPGVLPLVGVAAAVFALVLWISGIRSHDAAVRELRQGAEDVGHGGEVQVSSVTARPDEIGALARALRGASKELLRRSDEHALERDELKTVLLSIEEGLIACDRDLKILIWNPRATKLLAMAREPHAGMPLVDAAAHGEVIRAAREAIRTAEPVRGRNPIYGGAAGARRVEIRATPLVREIGDEQQALGAVLVLRDVTEVVERRRLQRDFAANVSHELRTPLSLIKGFLETLLDGAMEDKERGPRFLKIMERHVGGLERLVDDLLILLTLEGRTEDHEPTAIETAEVLYALVAGFEIEVEQKDMKLEVDLKDDLPPVLARPHHFERAVRNLIENALKYTEPGGSVYVRAFGDPGGVVIEIEDTGVGIPAEDLPHVFERFYRVDKSRSREAGGTGLGLAIVKRIMESEQGQVTVCSEVGEGTTFRLRFPVAV